MMQRAHNERHTKHATTKRKTHSYSRWLTDWVRRLVPAPSEELLIVARGQHVERFKVPRGDYPEVRARVVVLCCAHVRLLCVVR